MIAIEVLVVPFTASPIGLVSAGPVAVELEGTNRPHRRLLGNGSRQCGK